MINDKADEVIEELFQSLLSRYQIGLEFGLKNWTAMRSSEINFKGSGTYIDSPDWIKNKKATKNCINKKRNKCLKYAITVTLNHEEIGNILK